MDCPPVSVTLSCKLAISSTVLEFVSANMACPAAASAEIGFVEGYKMKLGVLNWRLFWLGADTGKYPRKR